MPASSVDTFLACSIMIALVLAAMASASNTLRLSMSESQHRNDAERFQQLALHLLLTKGAPTNWGKLRDTVPSSLGLSDFSSYSPYHLDIDKVSRLNNQNAFALSYAQLWQSLGVDDVSFSIEVRTLFNLTTTLTSTDNGVNETTYQFDVFADKLGTPVLANLRGYVVVRDYLASFTASTSLNGHAAVSVFIPNSKNGTALLITFAQANSNPQIVAFNAHAFSHNSSPPMPNRTFTKLSPLDHVLNVSFTYPNDEVQIALVLTYNYNFTLAEKSRNQQTAEYEIPNLLDSSPLLLVITGTNQSSTFAEWTSYPQVPLEIGTDFNLSDAGARTTSFNHVVTINSALYEIVTKWGGLG